MQSRKHLRRLVEVVPYRKNAHSAHWFILEASVSSNSLERNKHIFLANIGSIVRCVSPFGIRSLYIIRIHHHTMKPTSLAHHLCAILYGHNRIKVTNADAVWDVKNLAVLLNQSAMRTYATSVGRSISSKIQETSNKYYSNLMSNIKHQ